GKDTATGHWEIAGSVQEEAFPTYADGVPKGTREAFEKATGRKVRCNLPDSGTDVLDV
ncbi:phosphopentomutase, partial [Cetobacterium somerae]|nr:phosphopentomutase [Cetobacterium somerae]